MWSVGTGPTSRASRRIRGATITCTSFRASTTPAPTTSARRGRPERRARSVIGRRRNSVLSNAGSRRAALEAIIAMIPRNGQFLQTAGRPFGCGGREGCPAPKLARLALPVHVPRRLRRAAAFTLIELILVMAILIMAVSLSHFFRGRTLNSEARQLLALTRNGQSRAVSEGLPMDLWLDVEQGTFGLGAEP